MRDLMKKSLMLITLLVIAAIGLLVFGLTCNLIQHAESRIP